MKEVKEKSVKTEKKEKSGKKTIIIEGDKVKKITEGEDQLSKK
jgi:hypothetical protein